MKKVEQIVNEIIKPINDPKGRSMGSHLSALVASEVEMHKQKSLILGSDEYNPKAIETLMIEISEKAPTIYKVFASAIVYDTHKDLENEIIKWVAERLDEANSDAERKKAEEKWASELGVFLRKWGVIKRLRTLMLDDKKNESPKEKRKLTQCGLDEIFDDLKKKGYISGKLADWQSLCKGEDAPMMKLKWKYRNGFSCMCLIELLLLLGFEDRDEIVMKIENYFGVAIKNKRATFSKLKSKRSKLYKELKEIVESH
ncbi:MAG: hypothetical protein PUC90_03015 [Prevotella sp.]|nr:hypothetical protein [Prevotella sp.]